MRLPTSPRHVVPEGACDCHFHIFDRPSELVPNRSYSPDDATEASYAHLAQTLGLSRGVVVQPSVYGTDNRTTLGAFDGNPAYRRVVVIEPGTAEQALRGMTTQGVVGARINLLFSGGSTKEDVEAVGALAADQGWHLQFLLDVTQLDDLAEFVCKLPVPVVFDHMGHLPADGALTTPGFQTVLRLLDTGRVWVKLSGAYRLTKEHRTPYADVAPLARALIAANPERLVWGTDWPHPQIKTEVPDAGVLLDLLGDWAGDAASFQRILVQNPEQLYGFTPGSTAHDT